MRERRTGGPSGRALKHGVILVPDCALVAAQADPRSAADPLISLHDRGERGAPQPEAHNLEHPRQAQAEAEKVYVDRMQETLSPYRVARVQVSLDMSGVSKAPAVVIWWVCWHICRLLQR